MPHNMPGILVLVQLKAQSEEHEVLQHIKYIKHIKLFFLNAMLCC